MTIAREEIFGPVAAVIGYDTVDDAVAMANDNDYGLSGSCSPRTSTPASNSPSAFIRTFGINTFATTSVLLRGVKAPGSAERWVRGWTSTSSSIDTAARE